MAYYKIVGIFAILNLLLIRSTTKKKKQVECLAALCRAYVEVLFGGQSSSYVQTTLLVFLCCEATGG